jgi:hypothetical protein
VIASPCSESARLDDHTAAAARGSTIRFTFFLRRPKIAFNDGATFTPP